MDGARRRTLIAVLAGAAVAAGVATVVVAGRDDGAPAPRRSQPESIAAAPPAVRTSTPAATPSDVAPARETVAASRPSAFTVSGPAFTIRAKVCAMAPISPLDPPGDQHHTVCWVRSKYGVAPGSDSGTSYVLGHAWGRDPKEVLNPLSARATGQFLRATPRVVDGAKVYPVTNLNGYTVTLRTAHGTLTYTVRNAYGVRKSQLPQLRDLWNGATKGRVVIITCAQRAGRDYDYNVVTEAYLTSSERA